MSVDLIDLAGRTAVVTGGSRGVGRATALMLARAGADVAIAYRTRTDEAAAVVADAERSGVRAWAERGDLSEPADAVRLFDRVEREWRGLDLLVVNHGIWPPHDVAIESMPRDQWRRTLSVNLDSVYEVLRSALPRLREGGSVVLVSSTAGQRGEAFHADYAASKGALISMVKGLAGELGPRGIRINAVAPGWIDTEMAAPAFGEGGRDEIERGIPLGRIASPDDVAGPIVFLLSALARHITGEVLNVNGGAVLVG